MSPRALADFLLKRGDKYFPEFVAYYGEARFKRIRDAALRLRDPLQRDLRKLRAEGKRSHVVVVPNFLGSSLQVVQESGDRYTAWPAGPKGLSTRVLRDLLLRDDGRNAASRGVTVAENGLLHRYYDELSLVLLENYTVHHFDYDWRRDIIELGAQLDSFLELKFGTHTPEFDVHLVTHGLGSLVGLTMLALRQQRRPGEIVTSPQKLVMLGLPQMQGLLQLADSHAESEGPVTEARSLRAMLHSMSPHPDFEALLKRTLASFPSVFQMMRGNAGEFLTERDLHQRTVRGPNPIAAEINDGNPIKKQRGDRLRELERLLTESLPPLRDDDPDRLLLIDDVSVRSNAGDAGTWRELLLDLCSVKGCQVRVGGHAEDRRILSSIDDLLDKAHLDKQPTTNTTGQREEDSIPTLLDRLVLGWLRPGKSGAKPADSTKKSRITGPVIEVKVGDIGKLSASFDAIAVGHYEGVLPDGSEEAIDRALTEVYHKKRGGKPPSATSRSDIPPSQRLITQIATRGLFRGELGRMYLLPNPEAPDQSVVLLGMGQIGNFGMPELTIIVQQLMWHLCAMGKTSLQTVLIGSGSNVLPYKAAARAWVTGIQMAWRRLNELGTEPTLKKIQFVSQSAATARKIHVELNGCELVLVGKEQPKSDERDPVVIHLEKRPDDPIPAPKSDSASTRTGQDDGVEAPSEKPVNEIQTRLTIDRSRSPEGYRFALLTQQASIPERIVPLDSRLIHEACQHLILQRDLESQLDAGRLLCRLILPREFRVKLQTQGRLMLALDAASAAIPWEMLTTITGPLNDTDGNDSQAAFLAVGRAMVRQFVNSIAPAASPAAEPGHKVRILVVADPAAGRPLPGAREEAVLLGDLFERFNAEQQSFAARGKRKRRPLEVQYKLLIGPLEARRIEVIKELTREHYDVLHFAGHCSHDPQDPARSGWVFGVDQAGREELLTAREIDRIDKVPSFVFSNACESGVSPAQIGNYSPDLCPAFAAAFFRQGVQNFLGTGWPVGDRAARRFAWELYSGLLGVTAIDVESKTTNNKDKSRNEGTSEPETEQPTVDLNILPISEALQKARKTLIAEACRRMCPQGGTVEGNTHEEQTTEHEPDNLHLAVEHLQTWGAYQFYGNPEFRLLAIPTQPNDEETSPQTESSPKPDSTTDLAQPGARSRRAGAAAARSPSPGPARRRSSPVPPPSGRARNPTQPGVPQSRPAATRPASASRSAAPRKPSQGARPAANTSRKGATGRSDARTRPASGPRPGKQARTSSKTSRGEQSRDGGGTTDRPAGTAPFAAFRQQFAHALSPDRGGSTRAGGPPPELRRDDARVLSEKTIDALRKQAKVLDEFRGTSRRKTRTQDKAWKTLEQACQAACAAVIDDRLEVLQNPDLGRGLNLTLAATGQRPAYLVVDDEIVWESSLVTAATWQEKIERIDPSTLQRVLRGVGLIQLTTDKTVAGTGFVIGADRDLVVTNRHVARLFFSYERRTGGGLDWQSRGGTVVMDFGLEAQTRSDKRQRVVQRVVFAPPDEIPVEGPIQHNLPDVAILQLKKEPGAYLPEPLPLLNEVEPQPHQDLLIIGHPSKDRRYPEQGKVGEALKVVFGAQYGLKRVAPGEYKRLSNSVGLTAGAGLRSGIRGVTHRLAHDASTLGGNSGSPVLLLAPEAGCLGLHYAGQVANEPTDEANWAHDFFALNDVPNTVPGQPLTLGAFLSRVN
jgi:hypothetical protein